MNQYGHMLKGLADQVEKLTDRPVVSQTQAMLDDAKKGRKPSMYNNLMINNDFCQ
jgi:hypothetical protein